MKAKILNEKPQFNLLKQADIQSFYHLQMPRWLFTYSRYAALSLEAKVAYTFLLNRFQLSKLHGWINDDGAVFIIFTRQELADEMQISYKKAISCFKELAACELIWERRCGCGDANQIYLAKTPYDEQNDDHNCAPFLPEGSLNQPENSGDFRPAETAYQGNVEDVITEERPAENAQPDMTEQHIKTCENDTSYTAETECQDVPDLHTSNNNKNNIYINNNKSSQIESSHNEETAELKYILDLCELDSFPQETAEILKTAVERLFYCSHYRTGSSNLPRGIVREKLKLLNRETLERAVMNLDRVGDNYVINTTAYLMKVIFNTISEQTSDKIMFPLGKSRWL